MPPIICPECKEEFDVRSVDFFECVFCGYFGEVSEAPKTKVDALDNPNFWIEGSTYFDKPIPASEFKG